MYLVAYYSSIIIVHTIGFA